MSDERENLLAERLGFYKEIEENRGSKVIAYVTGDRPNLGIAVARDVIDIFTDHLDVLFHQTKRITLVLYTSGGDTLAAWNLINLMRMFCDDIEVLVITKAHSAGTLICLGANRIIMTKQATLSPIDPSLRHPLCPTIPNSNPPQRVSVSVEAIRSYIEFIKSESRKEKRLTEILADLSERVHPLVLGAVFRSQDQIQYLAGELLGHQTSDKNMNNKLKKRIIEFLVSKSGSHDYTINRREADKLGLAIEKPSQSFYDDVLKPLYINIKDELKLNIPFSPVDLVADVERYSINEVLGLVESSYKAHAFALEGTIYAPSKQKGIPNGIEKYDTKGWVLRWEK